MPYRVRAGHDSERGRVAGRQHRAASLKEKTAPPRRPRQALGGVGCRRLEMVEAADKT